MTDFAKLGIQVDSDPARKAASDLKDMAKAGDDATGSSKRLSNESKQLSNSVSKVGSVAKVAAAALTSYAVAGQFRAVIDESEQLQRNLLRTEQLIKSTGREAQSSAGQLLDQARGLARATLGSTEGIMEAQQILLTFKNVSTESFEEVTERALDLATVTGSSLTGAMNQLAKALEDPVLGLNAMRRSGVSFSEEQKRTIESMVAMNDVAGAQRVILNELASQYGGVAKREAMGFAGAQDSLGQAVQEARIALAEKTGVMETLTKNTNALSEAVEGLTESYLAGEYDVQLEIMKNITMAVAAAGVAYGGYRLAVSTATIAQLAFNAALRANPLVLAASGVATLATVTYSLVKANTAAKESEIALRAEAMRTEESQRAAKVRAIDAELAMLEQGTNVNALLDQRRSLFEMYEQAAARADDRGTKGYRAALDAIDKQLSGYDQSIQKINQLREAREALIKTETAEETTPEVSGIDPRVLDREKARVDARRAAVDAISAIEREFMSEQGRLTLEYIDQQNTIQNALEDGVIATEWANALKLESDRAYAIESQRITDQHTQAQLAAYATTLNALQGFTGAAINALEAYGKESSDVGKGLLLASKVLTVAQAIMAAELSSVMTRTAYASAAMFAGPKAPFVLAAGEAAAQINRGLGYASAALIAATEFAPARELGGQVKAGGSYLVGENGPELLTMGSDGHITSNRNMQEGGGQTIVMQISTGVAETVRSEINSLMPQIMRSMAQMQRARR